MIGWYAHHHGQGHITRARTVIAHMADDVTLFSSHPAPDVTVLPVDVAAPRSAGCAAAPPPVNLHYAPLGIDGVRERMATLAAWVDAHDPDLFVVDVSVEVAALMRLLGTPTAVVRQHGRRDDAAHEMCYRNASLLLAPYPEWLEDRWVPQWMRERTVYTGGFSRGDARTPRQADPQPLPAGEEGRRVVVVLTGAGGTGGWPVQQAARATPGWRWIAVGTPTPKTAEHGIGWVDNPRDWLRAADVVVTHAGHNAVMEAAATGRPTIVIPEDRPFDEQRYKAKRLQETGATHVELAWPSAARWPDLLDRVTAAPAWPRPLIDGHGAQRAADALVRTAQSLGRQVQHA